MIAVHEISRKLINSFCSLEMIKAFDRVIGDRSQINVRVYHVWDTSTNTRKIELKHRLGSVFYVLTLPEHVYPDSFKAPASTRPDVLAVRDIVSWLKTRAIEDLNSLRLSVEQDDREIDHDVVDQLVYSVGRENV